MQQSGFVFNLPADLPIAQWLERCENKETIIQSLKYEVIPPRTVIQSKGEVVKRCMFIVEGQILQCDQYSKKNTKEVDGVEGSKENTIITDDKYLIHPLERDNCTVLCAWELCENKVSQFMLRTGENSCRIAVVNFEFLSSQLLPWLKHTLSKNAILLEKYHLFRDISYALRLRIAEMFSFSVHPHGEMIFQENQIFTEKIVFFLQHGHFAICKKLRKFPENPSKNQQQSQQRILPSTLQKIISLSEGEIIGIVSGDSYQFSLKSETECKVGRVSYGMLRWMLKLWAIGSDEELDDYLKSTLTRISQKAESVQQQFYLQNQFRFENRSASEAKLARETFVTSVKDLFMNKVQSNSQKVLITEEQNSEQLQQQGCKTSINFDKSASKPGLISPKRQQSKRNSIRQHDSVLFLQKLTSNTNNINSPSSKELPTASLTVSVKDIALGHLNLFDQTPSNQEQKSQSSFTLSFQQQQSKQLQHRHSVSSYQSGSPSQLISPKTKLFSPRQTDFSLFPTALPSINKISVDTPESNHETSTNFNKTDFKQPRFHSFSTAFTSADHKYLNIGSPRNQHNLNINQNQSPSNNGISPNFNTFQNTTSAKSSFFSQIQHASKNQITEKQQQSYLNISKSSNNLISSPQSKDSQKNLTPREPSLSTINPQFLSSNQLAIPSTTSKIEKRASITSQTAVFSDSKNDHLPTSGKINIFPSNEITSTHSNHYSFLSTNSPTKSKEILKSKNILKIPSNFKSLNKTSNNSAFLLNINESPSTVHPLSHLKMKNDIDQLVKEKEIILTNLQERQKKNNSMNKKTISTSSFEQDLSKKPSLSAHISSSSPHHNNLVKKAVRDLENSAYFSLDFGTDTFYRRGFLAKLSAKIANY